MIAARSGRDWVAPALDAFAAHGLRDAARGDAAVELACPPRTEARSLRWCGAPLPPLAAAYTGACGFTLFACARSRFSPIGLPGSGLAYYRHAIAPALPRSEAQSGGGALRVLEGDGATHNVAQEAPALLARAVAEELRACGYLGPRVVTAEAAARP